MNPRAAVLAFGFLMVFFISTAQAQSPQLINFQAQLEGVTAPSAAVTFTIFDSETGGTSIWTESYPNLAVQSGRIQVLLGSDGGFDASVFEGTGDRFMEISVNGETLTPRTRISSVAYALRAAVADRVLDGGSGAGVSTLNSLSGDVILEGGTNVSITPDGQKLRIDATGGGGTGGITMINAGNGIAVSDVDGPTTEISLQDAITLGPNGNLDVTNGSGQVVSSVGGGAEGGSILVKEQPGNYNAVEASTRFSGATRLGGQIFVRGNDNFAAIHMFADGDTDGGRIVLREPPGNQTMVMTASDNAGRLVLFSADGDDAVVLETQNGEYGIVTAHTNTGNNGARMWGELTGTDSKSGNSLRGGSLAAFKKNGTNSSVWIRTNGVNDNTSWGVIGVSDADNNDSITLDGQNGDVSIAGTLSKGGGSFKIDHPLDPQNKYLSHSFVESPDMMNIYNGNVVLDDMGEGWVEMPVWFDALNRDFRYQLTCIGGQAMVYIAEELSENKFKIAGGTPGLKVSWQVTGVRQDPYAEANRIRVEEDKPQNERGSYLHPDAYGVPRN